MKSIFYIARNFVILAFSWNVISIANAATIDVTKYGALGDGVHDDYSSIEVAIKALLDQGGGELYFPKGKYLHTKSIDLSKNIEIEGDGDSTQLIAENPDDSALNFEAGDGCGVSKLTIISKGIKRSQAQKSAAIVISDSKNCSVQNVKILGSGSVGIMVANSNSVIIKNNQIHSTKADGVHVVNGSSHVTVENNYAEDTGDDSFAAVSYKNKFPQTSDVIIRDNTSVNSAARGASCIGATNCSLINNNIIGAKAHGIAIAYESAYDTYRPSNIVVQGGKIEDSGTKEGFNSILIAGADNVTIKNVNIVRGNAILVNDSTTVDLVGINYAGDAKKFLLFKKDKPSYSAFTKNGAPFADVVEELKNGN